MPIARRAGAAGAAPPRTARGAPAGSSGSEDDGAGYDDEGALLGLFAHVCRACGARRLLPFEMRGVKGGFVCASAELPCQGEPSTACASAAPADEPELQAALCARCGEQRLLPFEAGPGFRCQDVGLDCAAGKRSANKKERGQGRVPVLSRAIAGAECSEEEALSDFEAWQVDSLDDGGELVCESCGKTMALDTGGGPRPDRCRCAASSSSSLLLDDLPRPRAGDEADGLTPQEREKLNKAHQRTQLLWKVLIYDKTANEAAKLFRDNGFEPPSAEELLDLRSNTMESFKKKTVGARLAAKAALKSANKKGPVKRYLNNELVSVSKKDKYVRAEKESAEDKAKTSVELYVLGIGRGGRHAVKIAREENQKKKGPRSHK